MDDILKRLDHAAETEQSLPPWYRFFADAAQEIRRLRKIVEQHDLCHNLHGKVDARAFADGCADEQRKLYGCAPDADEIERLRAIVDKRIEAAGVGLLLNPIKPPPM